jgi:hypothetical protein
MKTSNADSCSVSQEITQFCENPNPLLLHEQAIAHTLLG